MVCFLTIFVGAVSLNLHCPFELCRWSIDCQKMDEDELPTHTNSDAVLLSILRCATIIYLFIKLRKISQLGSGYLIIGVCICLSFGALTFAATLLQLLQKDWTVVGAALPIFLLSVDLSRIVVVIQHSLTASSYSAVHDRIAEAMRQIGPSITFDTIIEVLVIMMSSTMRVRQLQEIFCFACLSVLLNYVIFTTFVPACLSIFLMNIRKKAASVKPVWYNETFSNVLREDCGEESGQLKFKLKLLICLISLMVNGIKHLYGQSVNQNDLQESFDSIFTLTPQEFFTLVIAMLLLGKIFVQNGSTSAKMSMQRTEHASTSRGRIPLDIPLRIEPGINEHAPRDLEKCIELLEEDSSLLTDIEILSLVKARKIQSHKLESQLRDPNRGVEIRRKLLSEKFESGDQQSALAQIPFSHYNFSKATTSCCENTVGYIPVPVGVCGPLLMNGEAFHVPMATTEGTLLASTNRGMKAVFLSGGVECTVYKDGMTRAPVVEFPTSREACQMAEWLQDPFKFVLVQDKFDETSRFGRLQSIQPVICGRRLYIRFNATTGDAMGMNMVSKGVEHTLKWLQADINHDMKIISLSGNLCTDKKSSAINWTFGRGKSVVAEATISSSVVKDVLKTDIDTLVHLNTSKNLIGSAMAGSIGGFNAHAANAVTALYIATGQDPAQNVEGSNCITVLEKSSGSTSDELLITCTMPCIEVATCGGGTVLSAQRACLNLLGLGGGSSGIENALTGCNAKKFAMIVCGTVLSSELSLLAALSAGHLVRSHMKHNRLPTEPRIPNQMEHGGLLNL